MHSTTRKGGGEQAESGEETCRLRATDFVFRLLPSEQGRFKQCPSATERSS